MLSFDDINKIEYYVNQCEIYNLDVRQLRNKIKSNEYERIPVDTRNKLKSRNDIKENKVKVIEIQRSRGYSTRKSITIEELEIVIKKKLYPKKYCKN